AVGPERRSTPTPNRPHREGPPPSRPPPRPGGPAAAYLSRTSSPNAFSTTSSTRTAPALSSGALPLPHLGDCTQDGHPVRQSQLKIAVRVAASQLGSTSCPRSANPAPPGCPSCTKTVGRPV